MKTIGFIGGGRITNILLQGFKRAGTTFEKVLVYDVNMEISKSLHEKHPYLKIVSSTQEAIQDVDLVVLAVHPPFMMEVLISLKEIIDPKTVIVSLAPKITIEKISGILGNTITIVRLNPSASSVVNRGVNPISFAATTTTDTREKLIQLFSPLGFTPVVEEFKLEAYAIISAMGPTYFFFQLQKMKELAISFGMDEHEAQTVISDMLWGATETLFTSGLSYTEVTDLIPVKPLGEVEEEITNYYDKYLNAIFTRIKP